MAAAAARAFDAAARLSGFRFELAADRPGILGDLRYQDFQRFRRARQGFDGGLGRFADEGAFLIVEIGRAHV